MLVTFSLPLNATNNNYFENIVTIYRINKTLIKKILYFVAAVILIKIIFFIAFSKFK